MSFFARHILALALCLGWSGTARAESPVVIPLESAVTPLELGADVGPVEYRTSRLLVYTDLPAEQALRLIERLETTLQYAAGYWGTPPRGRITCYVVDNLDNWTDVELPNRLARVIVGGVQGAAIPGRSGAGREARNTATVYASSRRGVAEHELVHAYCLQTFGALGPDWYKEGMAEMVVQRATRQTGIRCSPEEMDLLKLGCNRTIGQTVQAGNHGNQIYQSMQRMLADPKNRDQQVPLVDWSVQDSDAALAARRQYMHSWAFCYMLLHNPNYAARFKILGEGYVTKRPDAFAELFAPMREELAFEYSFFLQHIEQGFRVDLCSWDWQKRFRAVDAGKHATVRVSAGRGYQPSCIWVTAGQNYAYQCEGTWSTGSSAPATDADGRDGRGRLLGAVLHEFRLSEPIPLGVQGTFIAPSDGKLFLRCEDGWNELHDNQGDILVKIRRS